jgi:predicted  nucleic acid-binding Zn-ribbon protein
MPVADKRRGAAPAPEGARAGDERGQVKLPQAVLARVDALAERLAAEAVGAGASPAPFSSRAQTVSWLVERAEVWLAAEDRARVADARMDQAETAEARARAVEDQARAALDQVRQEQERLQRARVDMDYYVTTQTGIAQDVRSLFQRLTRQGLTPELLIAWGEALDAAGVSPRQAVEMMRLDGRGLRGLIADAQGAAAAADRAIAAGRREVAQLAEEVEALRLARSELERRARDAAEAVASSEAAVERARAAFGAVQAAAADLGAYIDLVRSAGVDHLARLPQDVGRVMAGVIVRAVVDTYGDDVLELPGSPDLPRISGIRVLLSEVPYLLAPRRAYEELERAAIRRQVRAEVLAAQDPGEEVGPRG